MVFDILLAVILKIAEFINADHLGFVQRVDERFRAFRKANGDDNAFPVKLKEQYSRFINAVVAEDGTFVLARKSNYTVRIADADSRRDQLYTQLRKLVKSFTKMTLDTTRHQAAVKLDEVFTRYKISIREAYETEGLKLQQLIQELQTNYQMELALKALGAEQLLADLKAANDECRQLIAQRNDERSYQVLAQLKTAREETDKQYEMLIRVLNACALTDENENRYEELIRLLNEDVDYYRKQVTAKRKRTKDDDEAEPEDEDGADAGTDANSEQDK